MPSSVFHVFTARHTTSLRNSLHHITLILCCLTMLSQCHVIVARDLADSDWSPVANQVSLSSRVSELDANSLPHEETNKLLTAPVNTAEIKAILPERLIYSAKRRAAEKSWSSVYLPDTQSSESAILRFRRQAPDTDADEDYDYSTYDQEYSDVLKDGDSDEEKLQSSLLQADMSTAAASPARPRQSKRIADAKSSEGKSNTLPQPSTISSEKQVGVNMPPHVQEQLRAVTAAAGHVLRWQLPEATFVDLESPDQRQLHVELLQPNDQLPDAQWLMFNSKKQQLIALPLLDNVGEHVYTLRATDSGGASVDTALRVSVIDDDLSSEKWNHQLLLSLDSTRSSIGTQVVWQLDLISRLQSMLSSLPDFPAVSVDDIVVHGVVSVPGRPYRITLSFSGLSRSVCPREQLAALRRLLISGSSEKEEESASAALSDALSPEFRVTRVQLMLLGGCVNSSLVVPEAGRADVIPLVANTAPVVRKPLAPITLQLGRILDQPLADQLFNDVEDGGMWNMSVRLLYKSAAATTPAAVVGNSSWIQLNTRERRLQALPFSKQLVGKHTLFLECTDAGALSVTSTVSVLVVTPAAPLPLPALELRLHVRVAMGEGEQWRPAGVDGVFLARIVARAVNDSVLLVNVSSLQQPQSRGLFLLSWHSDGLVVPPPPSAEESPPTTTTTHCPVERMRAAARHFGSRALHLSAKHPQVGVSVQWAGIGVTGACRGVRLPGALGGVVRAAVDRQQILLSYVVPAVLMLVMVVVAALVAWQLVLLQRRRRRHTPASQHTPSSSSSPNGVKPLIPPDASVQEMSRLVPAGQEEPLTAETPMLDNGHASV